MGVVYILIAILIFGLLIATHELGHFLTAKLLGVQVNEFSVGMGPALWSREKGETLYSLRAFPIGGYCAMEGEDEESDNPRAFGRAAGWKKIIILCAGAAMNFVTGLVILAVLMFQLAVVPMPAVASFTEGYGLEDCGLRVGDVILSVNGRSTFSLYGIDVAMEALDQAGDTVDLVIVRGEERITLENVSMPRQERTAEDGTVTNLRGLSIGLAGYEAGFGERLLYGWYGAADMVKIVWSTLGDLIQGAVGLRDLSGPVGIVDMMTDVGSSSPTAADAVWNLAYLAAFIAVSLAVMNLLPLPALDGGRVFFLLLNGVLYALFRKKIDAKYEGYVHLAGLAALMVLMLVVTLSDVGKLFGL